MPEFHLPRLSRFGVTWMVENMDQQVQLDFDARRLAADRWTTTGRLGAREATLTELSALADNLRQVAMSTGLDQTPDSRRRFDTACTILLSEPGRIPLAEGLRDDVWSWITTVLCPDLVEARFGRVEERYRGGVRNTFQRLWTRGVALRDPVDALPHLVGRMSEDANVQVFERPGLSASIRTTRLVAERWRLVQVTHGNTGLEDLTRRAMVGLGVVNQIVSLDALDDTSLEDVIRQQFDLAMPTSHA